MVKDMGNWRPPDWMWFHNGVGKYYILVKGTSQDNFKTGSCYISYYHADWNKYWNIGDHQMYSGGLYQILITFPLDLLQEILYHVDIILWTYPVLKVVIAGLLENTRCVLV